MSISSASARVPGSTTPSAPPSSPPASPPPALPPSSARAARQTAAAPTSACAAAASWLARRGASASLAPALQAALAAADGLKDPAARAHGISAAIESHAATLGLRLRERRSLTRSLVRAVGGGGADAAPRGGVRPYDPAESSDDEGAADAHACPPAMVGGHWPVHVRFATECEWSPDVPPELRARYAGSAPGSARARPRRARPCNRVFVAVIPPPAGALGPGGVRPVPAGGGAPHPAAGQCGLFAARRLRAGERVIDYVGVVTAGAAHPADAGAGCRSDYELDFGDASELAVDAQAVGSEARFVNDYRNTGAHANVEFGLRRGRSGELRMGVYVCAPGGVAPGEELLVSYGKPYWRARVPGGDLGSFVTRFPTTRAHGPSD